MAIIIRLFKRLAECGRIEPEELERLGRAGETQLGWVYTDEATREWRTTISHN